MYKEACKISATPKVEEKPSAADRWSMLKLKILQTEGEQPKGCVSERQSASGHQGQTGTGNVPPSTRNRQPTVKKYLDRITIAGLHNYLYATDRYEKVTWHLTFLLGIVGTMFYLVTITRTYLEFTIVLDIQHDTEPSVHLPDVWVCAYTVNVSYVSEQFEKARSKLLVDRRIQVLVQRWMRLSVDRPAGRFYSRWNSTSLTYETDPSVWNPNTTSWDYQPDFLVDCFIVWAKQFALTSPVDDDFRTLGIFARAEIELLYSIAVSLGADWPGYKTFYEEGMFGCESVMKNCTLNGIAFDCCTSGSMGYSQPPFRCFRLDINQTASRRNLQQSRSSSIALSFETIIDSAYFREFHSSKFAGMAMQANAAGLSEWSEAVGINVAFGPRLPALFDIYQKLAPATASTMTVQAIKRIERTNCVNAYRFDPHLHIDSHPLLTNYFKEMEDPLRYTVSTCEMGKLLDVIYIRCGCILYYDTIRPQNDSVICTPAHMYSCLYMIFHDVSPEDTCGDSSSSSNRSHGNAEDDLKRAMMRQLKAASALECLPLCKSWTYDFRASSMIAEGSEGNISRYFRNKVNIIFDPEYRVETEVYKMDYTALIASLGDGFGLILGCSAITLIQFPLWTVAALVLRRKLRKISPLSRHVAIHGRPNVRVHKESVV